MKHVCEEIDVFHTVLLTHLYFLAQQLFLPCSPIVSKAEKDHPPNAHGTTLCWL